MARLRCSFTAVHEAILDIATAAITSADDGHHGLLAHAVDWLTNYREHETFYRHLLRDADRITTNACLARWTW